RPPANLTDGDVAMYEADTVRSLLISAALAARKPLTDSVAAEREACARMCDEVAEDLIRAMRDEGETDEDEMKSIVASARVCAQEIRDGYSEKLKAHGINGLEVKP
ncbi:MAG: hypothetical protein KGN32_17115, partial [Burkholderiales bacterium]|nr:hypothetical protein [Burkholderiales bacterium]